MYLAPWDVAEETRLKTCISNCEERLRRLEAKYKSSYTVINFNGGSYEKNVEGYNEEIEHAKRALKDAKRDLENFYNSKEAENRDMKKREHQRQEEKDVKEERRNEFKKACERWENKNFIYKLFHLKTRPSKLKENYYKGKEMDAVDFSRLHR